MLPILCICLRRMFPHCSVSLTGLQPSANYVVMVDIVPADTFKYKVRWGLEVCSQTPVQPSLAITAAYQSLSLLPVCALPSWKPNQLAFLFIHSQRTIQKSSQITRSSLPRVSSAALIIFCLVKVNIAFSTFKTMRHRSRQEELHASWWIRINHTYPEVSHVLMRHSSLFYSSTVEEEAVGGHRKGWAPAPVSGIHTPQLPRCWKSLDEAVVVFPENEAHQQHTGSAWPRKTPFISN